jgi:hypothetical protein
VQVQDWTPLDDGVRLLESDVLDAIVNDTVKAQVEKPQTAKKQGDFVSAMQFAVSEGSLAPQNSASKNLRNHEAEVKSPGSRPQYALLCTALFWTMLYFFLHTF